jgi:twinkle protein
VGIMPGYSSVWTGIPNHGKTTLIKQVTWSLCQSLNKRAAVGSFEEAFARDYKRSALHYLIGRPKDGWPNAGGEWTRPEITRGEEWMENHLVAIDPHGYGEKGGALEEFDPTLDWVLDAATTAVVRHGCKLVVIDPWGEIDQRRDKYESEHDYIGRALSRFNRLARQLKVHVAIVAHPRKMETAKDGAPKIPGPYDIAGSSYFYNKPSLGVTVHRDPAISPDTKEPDPNSTRTQIWVWKSKFQDVQGKPGKFHLDYIPRDGRFAP